MKRFASVVNTLALAAALVGAGTAAQSQSAMYLVPISPLNVSYYIGDTISVAVTLTLGTSSFTTFSVPTAVGYLNSQFEDPSTFPGDPTYFSAPISQKFIGPKAGNAGGTASYTLWNASSPDVITSTKSQLSGEMVQAAGVDVGHSNTVVKINGINTTLTIPAGTYTVVTYSFLVASTAR